MDRNFLTSSNFQTSETGNLSGGLNDLPIVLTAGDDVEEVFLPVIRLMTQDSVNVRDRLDLLERAKCRLKLLLELGGHDLEHVVEEVDDLVGLPTKRLGGLHRSTEISDRPQRERVEGNTIGKINSIVIADKRRQLLNLISHEEGGLRHVLNIVY